MRILLVEDDLAVCHEITSALEAEGLEYDVACTTADALVLLRRNDFGVAILDHYLENETSVFLASHLRLRHQDTKIVTITGSALYAKGLDLDRMSTDFLFRKPFPVADLVEIVKYLAATEEKLTYPVEEIPLSVSV